MTKIPLTSFRSTERQTLIPAVSGLITSGRYTSSTFKQGISLMPPYRRQFCCLVFMAAGWLFCHRADQPRRGTIRKQTRTGLWRLHRCVRDGYRLRRNCKLPR